MSMNYGWMMGEALDSAFGATLGVFTGIFVIMMLLCFAVAIAQYVLTAVGMYTIAKRRGLRLYGLAWVPIASSWVLGSIADQYDRKAQGRELHLRTILLIGAIVSEVLAIALIVFTILMLYGMESMLALVLVFYILLIVVSIAYTVFYFIALYKTYRSCTTGSCVWMLILSIFFSIATPICLMCVKNKDGGFLELQEKQHRSEPEADAC